MEFKISKLASYSSKVQEFTGHIYFTGGNPNDTRPNLTDPGSPTQKMVEWDVHCHKKLSGGFRDDTNTRGHTRLLEKEEKTE